MHFSQIILKLKEFWLSQGCNILHSYDRNVGAGTLSPFTVFGALSPSDGSFCYEQYSRRPADGRFGENPNRLSGYYQFQVILKPYPTNSYELYLESLETLGIDLTTNSISLLEDDWENPSIGASGIGSEVSCNGVEISQWTYMQKIGGVPIEKPVLEITYGLERIASLLQNVNHIFEISYSPSQSYGDIFSRAEFEYSTFYQKSADSEMYYQYFDKALKESARLAELKLFYPAYDFSLDASHYLNVLDALGVLGVAQRADMILQVRTSVNAICKGFLNTND